MQRATANRILFILALVGAGISLHLTLAHMNLVDIGCGGSGGCETVALSRWANGMGIAALKGIPTAVFGLLMYITLAVLSFIRVIKSGDKAESKYLSLQGLISIIGLCGSAWLTWLEANVIHAWCRWCVASAITNLLIVLLISADIFAHIARLHGDKD